MNSSPTKTILGADVTGANNEHRIFLRLTVPPIGIWHLVYPSKNHVATGLLAKLIDSKLSNLGISFSKAIFGFEFNRSVYKFSVSQLAPALQLIKQELIEQGLLKFSQIAWADDREGIQRTFYPEGVRFSLPNDEEFDAGEKEFVAMEKALNEAIQKHTDANGK